MTDTAAAERTGVPEGELRMGAPVDLRRATKLGFATAAAMILVAATGIVATFQPRYVIDPLLPLGITFLYMVPFIFGWSAGSPPPAVEGFRTPPAGARNVLAGLIAGSLGGAGIVLLLIAMNTVDLRGVFIELSPELADILTFGLPLGAAIPVIIGLSGAIGCLGGSMHLLGDRLRRSLVSGFAWVLVFSLMTDVVGQFFVGIGLEGLGDVFYVRRGGALTIVGAAIVFAVAFVLTWMLAGRKTTVRSRYAAMDRGDRAKWSGIAAVVVAAFLFFLPRVMGPFVSQVLDTAGIYLLMALGLNIVVGYAGMLDLGYVAFFAVGAYTTAILTSPQSPAFAPEWSWLAAIPLVVVAAAVAGITVAAPVIRMRGDYLAIVTLGFGEIARILLNSEWLAPIFGGAQGITNIPNLKIGPIEFTTPQAYFYPIFFFVVIAAYVTYALERSRWGRAWMAMREDESVAEAMGINIVTAKLSAFVVGAVLASFGGAIFAAQLGSVFPHTFDIVVSLTVLVIIIVGGMGSVPGVAVGALILIGLPNLLREFSEYQFLFYGILLIIMMLKKPEGFIPSKRRAQELHQEEMMQDAWLEIYEAEKSAKPATVEATE
jgi:branched-chain amino acid transport system permease protein